MSSEDQDKRPDSEAPDRAADLGRKAGKLLKNARPRLEQAGRDAKRTFEDNRPRMEQAGRDAKRKLEANRPRAEQAGRDAWRYAQEHEDEIRAAAIKGARMRFGPLGYVIDALGANDSSNATDAKGKPKCPTCQTENAANARFCSDCGAELHVDPPGSRPNSKP